MQNETISWSGGCNASGIAEGSGTLQWYENGKPGQKFIGEVKNGQYHYGESILSDGETYKGGFLDGKRHGQGVASWPRDNSDEKGGWKKYSGNFRNGSKEGYGEAVTWNGDTYKGTWSNDKRTGQTAREKGTAKRSASEIAAKPRQERKRNDVFRTEKYPNGITPVDVIRSLVSPGSILSLF
ncbi:hypothetical protein [uncultured Thiodictyon sp.]|uniref:hypothetical protein n=1 Tax=uncultured Thiodictyon sp. TaxID=1846217 RepID=UPI0025FA439F|nr:hypothetical protein [uncultured Thiodictyon sp.]